MTHLVCENFEKIEEKGFPECGMGGNGFDSLRVFGGYSASSAKEFH